MPDGRPFTRLGLVALGLLIPCGAALAFEAAPKLKRVSGLEAGDVLNVRAEPSASSEDLGDLKQDAVVEALETSSDGQWLRIIWNEGNGWISADYLEDMDRPMLDSGMPVGLMCVGTEPFWSLRLGGDGLLDYDIEGVETSDRITWSSSSRNQGSVRHAFRSDSFAGVLRSEECSDGMSDIAYGWSLDLLIEQEPRQFLSACCSVDVEAVR